MISANNLSMVDLTTVHSESKFLAVIEGCFTGRYTISGYQSAAGGRVPILQDVESRLNWALVPAGEFQMGMSEEEERAAIELSPNPFLSFPEMRPVKKCQIDAFLVTQSPLGVRNVTANIPVLNTIGPDKTALLDQDAATRLAGDHQAYLPSECEWERGCRAATTSIFWFGSRPLTSPSMDQILGLSKPLMANDFGLLSLFFGEWCSDVWRPSFGSREQPKKGLVIRGGAARFWPWQDAREWAGCASAFRMPSQDTGGAGAAVRLVRRQKFVAPQRRRDR